MDPQALAFVILIAYFIPTAAAYTGRRGSVFIVNLFFGWTFIGWVIALFMAIRSRESAKGVV